MEGLLKLDIFMMIICHSCTLFYNPPFSKVILNVFSGLRYAEKRVISRDDHFFSIFLYFVEKKNTKILVMIKTKMDARFSCVADDKALQTRLLIILRRSGPSGVNNS